LSSDLLIASGYVVLSLFVLPAFIMDFFGAFSKGVTALGTEPIRHF